MTESTENTNTVSDQPEVVCLCGSTRFKDKYLAEQERLTMEGKIFLTVGLFGHDDDVDLSNNEKKMLDELHKRKIDLADRVHVINVDGYVGNSTRSEIEYAIHSETPVTYLHKTISCPECDSQNQIEAIRHQKVCHNCRTEMIA